MAERTCYNCVYCVCDPCLWLRWLWEGQSIVPQCANHPQWPGELHDVPGVPCRSYRPKPDAPQGPGVRMIPLSDGGYAYVDAADYEWLNRWQWHLCSSGYAARWEKGKRIYMHRQILKPRKGRIVDHHDGNRANNCRSNIRICTHQENLRNRRKRTGSRSRFKCVYYSKQLGKWYSRCWFEGKDRVLGYFDTEEEAARAYDRAAVGWFGEFARLNFPREWPPERRAQVQAEYQKTKTQVKGDKGKVKRKKERSKKTSNRAGTQGRRGQKRSTRSARATTARPRRRVKRKKTRRGE